MSFNQFLLYFLTLVSVVQTARICVFSVSTNVMNYRSGYDVLLEALIKSGHEVALYSPLQLGSVGNMSVSKSLKHIRPNYVVDQIDTFFEDISPLEWRRQGKGHVIWDTLPILHLDICHNILNHRDTHSWLSEDTGEYDLFIVDSLWNECGLGLAHAFQTEKVIMFGFHTSSLPWIPDSVGGPVESSWIPDSQYGEASMGFIQRIKVTLRTIRWHIYRNSFTFVQIRKFFRKFLKLDNFPEIRELEKNVSLVMTNSHFSEEYARSFPPGVIPVGGFHIRNFGERTDIPSFNGVINKNVQSWIQSLKKSSKYFFLVNIGCSPDTMRNFPDDSLEIVLKTMEKIAKIHPVKFIHLWKNRTRLSSLPVSKNILHEYCSPSIVPYLLAHEQIRGFISHGNLLDVQEAIYHAVPMILLPVAFDQDSNAERVHRLERGILLEITSLTQAQLSEAINNILGDSK